MPRYTASAPSCPSCHQPTVWVSGPAPRPETGGYWLCDCGGQWKRIGGGDQLLSREVAEAMGE